MAFAFVCARDEVLRIAMLATPSDGPAELPPPSDPPPPAKPREGSDRRGADAERTVPIETGD